MGVALVDLLVEAAQKCDGLQILPATILVGDPLTLPTGVVQVQHRGYCVQAKPIHMIFIQPEEGTTNEKPSNLIAAIIEDEAIPIGVDSFTRIGVLDQMGSVEKGETMLVIGKMGRYPVQDHANVVLVEAVDKVHEVPGLTVSAGGGKIPYRLVPP